MRQEYLKILNELKTALVEKSDLLFYVFLKDNRWKHPQVTDQIIFEMIVADHYSGWMDFETKDGVTQRSDHDFYMRCLKTFSRDYDPSKQAIDYKVIVNMMTKGYPMDNSQAEGLQLSNPAIFTIENSDSAHADYMVDAMPTLVSCFKDFDINVQNELGWTILMMAMERCTSHDQINKLASLGADFNVCSFYNGKAIHFINAFEPYGFEKFVAAVNHGANPNEGIDYHQIFAWRSSADEFAKFSYGSFSQYIGRVLDETHFNELYAIETEPGQFQDPTYNIYRPGVVSIAEACRKLEVSISALGGESVQSLLKPRTSKSI